MRRVCIFWYLIWVSILLSPFLCELDSPDEGDAETKASLGSFDTSLENTIIRPSKSRRFELFTYASNQYTTIKGGVESEEKINNRRKLSKKRNMVDNFISSSDSSLIEKYIESIKDTMAMTYPGNYARGVQDYHQNVTAIVENGWMDVNKLLLYAIFKATDYIETFFKTELRYDVIAVSIRNIPGLVYHMNLHRVTKTQFWCHQFHSDYCSAGDSRGDGRITCEKNTEKKDRQFTAALYFNELGGGEFAFIDVPTPESIAKLKAAAKQKPSKEQASTTSTATDTTSKGHRRLHGNQTADSHHNHTIFEDLSTEKSRSVGQSMNRRQYLRNLAATSPKIKLAHPENTLTPRIFENTYIQKYAVATLYAPKPGRLVMFTSGVENIHAVTEITSRNRSRYMLNLWFTPANYSFNLGENFWTGCKRSSVESCHNLANFSF